MHIQNNVVLLDFELDKLFVAHSKGIVGKDLPF